MLILCHCHVPKLSYLTRQIFPVDLQAAAKGHDNMTRLSFETIVRYNHLNDINWKQGTLKIKFVGFGLTQISQISPTAFLSSWCQAMKDLTERFLSFFDLVIYVQSSKSLPESIGSTAASSYQALLQMPKSNHEDGEQQSLDDLISYPKKLQH